MVSVANMECYNPYMLSDMSTFQPALKDYTNLPCCSCDDALPSIENPWCCFTTELLTPPLSPEQGHSSDFSGSDNLANSFLPNSSTCVEDLLNSNFSHDFPRELPDLKHACTELFEQEQLLQVHENPKKIFSQPSSKDCMWNGRGFRPALRTRRQSRSISPGSPSCSPVSGCIDPRFVFQSNEQRTSSSPRRCKPFSGAETPSDSEEEVDVVTVEKSSLRVLRQTAKLNVVSDDGKVVGTLVQKKKTPLTLVTSGSCLENGSSPQIRGRSQYKTKTQPAMSMIITNGSGTTKTVNVQLKCVPLLNSSSGQVVKKKVAGENGTLLHVMKLSPNDNSRKENIENPSFPAEKKGVLSLDGSSMMSNTGMNRMRKDTVAILKKEPIQLKEMFSSKQVKNEASQKVDATSFAEKKKPKKVLKRSLPYDSPTSSPGSSNGDGPTSPKKKSVAGRSSGSEEDTIRAAHNVLERQRREGLRNLYNELRMVVPEISEMEKAPKVCILTKAKEHVFELQLEASELRAQRICEEERHENLQRRLREMAEELTSIGSITSTMYRKREHLANREKYAVFVN